MKKKSFFLIGGLTLTVLAGIGTTLGYFTAKETVTNTFTVGNLKIGVQEVEWNPEDGDGQNMSPGDCYYKNPTVKNLGDESTGGQACYARMILSICDKNGDLVEDEETIKLIKQTIRYDFGYTGTYSAKGTGSTLIEGHVPGYSLASLEECPINNPYFMIDTARTQKNKIVFYYWGKDHDYTLNPGDEEVLFSNIVIPTDWTQTEIDKVGDFQLVIKAEAIQATGFKSYTDAFTALDAATA